MIMMIKFNDNNYDIDATDDNNVNDWKMMILQMIFLEKPLIKMKNPTLCHSFIYMYTGSDMSYLLIFMII